MFIIYIYYYLISPTMNNSENIHCRLCAELKPSSKLVFMNSDGVSDQEIELKLKRLNVRLDTFNSDILPRTVCFVCISSLERTYEFVKTVEHAQEMLNEILIRHVKKEQESDENSDSDGADTFFDSQGVKLDGDIKIKLENNEDIKPLLICGQEKNKRRKKKLKPAKSCLDSIPLSQLKLTWKDYSWTCSYCETQFTSVDELRNHSIEIHHCCNAFKCTDCNVRKLRLDSFLLHIKRHKKYLKLSCHVCYEKFSTPFHCNSHRNIHKHSDYICSGCNASFVSSEELNGHKSTYFKDKRSRGIPILPIPADSLTCVLCKKVFKSKGSLNTHLLTHTDRKRDHTCDKCGKCFFNKQNLAGHMLLHDDARPYQCEICKFGFKTLGQLRNHVGVHDGKKPYSCDQCGRCFRLPKQLKSHSIIHTDELPYICAYCGKGFRFKTILNQHVRQHTGVKPYSCEFCQRDFTNWPNYNKHMKRRHGLDMAKKKHTPEGLYPINPATGEVIMYPETNDTQEWKKQMMMHRRPGRPKVNVAESYIEAPTKLEDVTNS